MYLWPRQSTGSSAQAKPCVGTNARSKRPATLTVNRQRNRPVTPRRCDGIASAEIQYWLTNLRLNTQRCQISHTGFGRRNNLQGY